MSILAILLLILIIALFIGPITPYGQGWAPYANPLGVVLIIILVLLLTGHLG